VTCCARAFYSRRPATGKACLSPTVDRRVRRTIRDVDEAERRRCRSRPTDARYGGRLRCRAFTRQQVYIRSTPRLSASGVGADQTFTQRTPRRAAEFITNNAAAGGDMAARNAGKCCVAVNQPR